MADFLAVLEEPPAGRIASVQPIPTKVGYSKIPSNR